MVQAYRRSRRALGLPLLPFLVAGGSANQLFLGVVVVCLSMILEDAAILIIGVVVGLVGIVVEVALGAAVVDLFRRLW